MNDLKIPVGISDFAKIQNYGYYYVDKTGLIADLLEKETAEVTLITRPRRFGKTMGMSMLANFFDIRKDSKAMFEGLEISKNAALCSEWMNQWPVLFLTFKDVDGLTFASAKEMLLNRIAAIYNDYSYLLEGTRVQENDRKVFERLADEVSGNPTDAMLKTSIVLLMRLMRNHYGKPVILLIDEYDVPLENAYLHGFYDKMIGFIRSLFESALKTNPYLEKGVITGCLRISKESVFTGLNNLAVESILSMNYPGAFGFTEPEVKAMMEYFDRADQYPELKKWYDGYCFGKTEIYNPWSILNYLYMGKNDPDYLPRPYWSNTSSNSIVREMVAEADDEAKEDLETLMNGGTIEKRVHEDITYGDIHQTQDNLWNFLFFTGYLKKVSERKDAAGETLYLTMKIPNTEVKTIYRESISYWFDQRMKETDRGPLLHSLETGDCEAAEDFINSQLADTISYYDYAENFYHGFMAGLLVNIGGYRVKSNRESGNGRPDIVMTELKFRGRAMILELKVSETINGMEKKCEEGLAQIEKGNYAQPLTDDGYQPILKYAVCFFKKGCMVRKAK